MQADRDEANARLIAAAPRLLRDLECAVIDAEQRLTLAERLERAEQWKETIKKAKGQA